MSQAAVNVKRVNPEKIIGLVGAVLTTLMFSSMIEIAWNNYRGITTIWIQPILTIVSNAVWFAYGIYRKDLFILIANGAGIFFAAITICAIFL